jgi:hypothetical protein
VRSVALPVLLLALATGAAADPAPEEVRIHLLLSRRPHGTEPERDRIRELEEELVGRLQEARAGQLARDRWEDGTCVVTLEGPDARRAWSLVEPAVRRFGARPGSYVELRTRAGAAGDERIPLVAPVTPPR